MFNVSVPTRTGRKKLSAGTKDRPTAKRIERMLEIIGPKGSRQWDLLDRVAAGSLDLGTLLDAYEARDLDGLRQRIIDVDLDPLVPLWAAALAGPANVRKVSADTIAHYVAAVRSLVVAGMSFPTSALTSERLDTWLESMAGITRSTVRKRGIGMRSFANWLCKKKFITKNPMHDVDLPGQGDPRVKFLEVEEARLLAEAQPSPFREYAALLAGSGIEVSVALKLRRRDVDLRKRTIRAAGTKTYTRDRVVRVANWAWPYVEAVAANKLPDALLFEGIADRWRAQDAHAAAREDLVRKGFVAVAGYTMRDHRHTYAVRAIRAGTPAEVVARQLGHVNAILVLKVYGRFAPTDLERDHWEEMATRMDERRTADAAVSAG